MSSPDQHARRAEFIARHADLYEHSPWVAERTFDAGIDADASLGELHAAFARSLLTASREEQLAVILAHPDLAGRAALRGELTSDSTDEQASAGLDACSAEEFARFQQLNDAYRARFGFPFIMAVRGASRGQILDAFAARLHNSPEQEFAEALEQINRIALLRLQAR